MKEEIEFVEEIDNEDWKESVYDNTRDYLIDKWIDEMERKHGNEN